jgi:hypothetical protein
MSEAHHPAAKLQRHLERSELMSDICDGLDRTILFGGGWPRDASNRAGALVDPQAVLIRVSPGVFGRRGETL